MIYGPLFAAFLHHIYHVYFMSSIVQTADIPDQPHDYLGYISLHNLDLNTDADLSITIHQEQVSYISDPSCECIIFYNLWLDFVKQSKKSCWEFSAMRLKLKMQSALLEGKEVVWIV